MLRLETYDLFLPVFLLFVCSKMYVRICYLISTSLLLSGETADPRAPFSSRQKLSVYFNIHNFFDNMRLYCAGIHVVFK